MSADGRTRGELVLRPCAVTGGPHHYMLSPADQAFRGTLADDTSERSAYFNSVAGRSTLSAPTHAGSVLANWTSSPDLVRGADLSRAFIVQADYPRLAGNNAGFEALLAAPDAIGAWRIWVVR